MFVSFVRSISQTGTFNTDRARFFTGGLCLYVELIGRWLEKDHERALDLQRFCGRIMIEILTSVH